MEAGIGVPTAAIPSASSLGKSRLKRPISYLKKIRQALGQPTITEKF